MKNIIALFVLTLMFSGCGQVGRVVAKVTGKSKSCIDGVQYIQFASGVTVAYNQDSTVKTCS